MSKQNNKDSYLSSLAICLTDLKVYRMRIHMFPRRSQEFKWKTHTAHNTRWSASCARAFAHCVWHPLSCYQLFCTIWFGAARFGFKLKHCKALSHAFKHASIRCPEGLGVGSSFTMAECGARCPAYSALDVWLRSCCDLERQCCNCQAEAP